jgi:hypothetical protein
MSGLTTIDSWVNDGRGRPLASSVAHALHDHVNKLPWRGTTGLDWGRMPASIQLNLVGKSDDDVYRWARQASVGAHDELAVWYSRERGGIIVPLREGIMALNELYRGAPGPRFSFGVETGPSGDRVILADILQYGYGDLLIATASLLGR